MSELSNLITRLQRGISRNASYVKTIRHPQLLLASLQELNDLIGNDKVKDAVATQVSHLIMIKRRALESSSVKEDEVMLNTVLYGPPGVGKTLIGAKLAKIWYSLGYLDGSRNTKEKKQEIGDILKDLFKDTGGAGASGSADDTTLTLYVMFIFIMIFITVLSMAWSFYNRFGGFWTLAVIGIILLIILVVGYYVSASISNSNSGAANKDSKDSKDSKNSKDSKGVKDTKGSDDKGKASDTSSKKDTPPVNNKSASDKSTKRNILYESLSDDQVIKVVTRADFVDRYVGWTSPKTNKLLEENLGKVVFVDEAYSLLNGPHDEFGMEALTALNLFLSQHSKEIIVIFAGYKDLLESGPYSVQPGLKRRFMWQFDCDGYTPEQLFEIFKMQLKKKGWGVSDEASALRLFLDNYDAFPAFGGDTERAGFFAELEHSRDFLSNEQGMQINMLEPKHIQRGIQKLRDNNIHDNPDAQSSNPLANMMRLMQGTKQNPPKPKPTQAPLYREDEAPSRRASENVDAEVLDAIRARAVERIHN